MEKFSLIGDYLHYWAREAPDRDALVLDDIRWTYKEFKTKVEACAKAFISNGVKKGDRVLLLSSPRPEFMVIYIAATEIGAVWGGLNIKSQLDEYQYRLSHSKPKILISQLKFDGRDYTPDLETLMKENPGILKLVTLDGIIKDLSVSFEEFLNEADKVTQKKYYSVRKVVKTKDPAMIVYTSGTTGKPKGALLAHKGLIASYVNQKNYIKLSSPMRCIVPGGTISHIGVAGDCSTWTLINGGGIYFSEKFIPGEILEIVQHERITFLPGVPTMFQMELALPNFEEYDLSSLEVIWWSGAAAPKDMVNRLEKLGIQLSTSYGMTETSGSVTFTRPEATFEELLMTIGRPAFE